MGFLIYCSNKNCGKTQEPLLNLEDNEVYCSECDKAIPNIPSFTKTQMKTMGQVLRARKKTQEAFSVTCENCKRAGQPQLDKKTDTLFCRYCQTVLKIAGPIAHAIKIWLKDQIK